jgi:hypothetical protein
MEFRRKFQAIADWMMVMQDVQQGILLQHQNRRQLNWKRNLYVIQ